YQTGVRSVIRDRKVFANPLQCRQEVFRWCIRYNTRRRHSWCGQIPPDVFESRSTTLNKAAYLPPTCLLFGGQALIVYTNNLSTTESTGSRVLYPETGRRVVVHAGQALYRSLRSTLCLPALDWQWPR